MKSMNVRITLTEEMLGTASANPEIHAEYIASKVKDNKDELLTDEMRAQMTEEEIQAVADAQTEKAMTVFSRNKDGRLVMWDYQIRGFFKSACKALNKVPKTKSAACKAYRQNIDGRIHVYGLEGRMIPIEFAGDVGDCQRPLRASTAQGERVTLANSETVPAGAEMIFEVECLIDDDLDMVREWLDYGNMVGLGQWRNSGKGRFVWEELDENRKVTGGNKGKEEHWQKNKLFKKLQKERAASA